MAFPPPVVGFDLDMTLADSAEGIVATLLAVGAELGHELDPDDLRTTIGLPLDAVWSARVPAHQVPLAVERYRALYEALGVPPTVPLPGAAAAVDAVRSRGGRVIVISAKIAPAVQQVLVHIGIEADEVVGGLFAESKGAALADRGAWAYVGDHPGDIRAARTAGAHAVAVATGPHSAGELAGADIVLADLTEFPAWLAGRLGAPRASRQAWSQPGGAPN